jgi:hypothetical protein
VTYCGKLVTQGHGDSSRCGEPYWGAVWQCDACKIKDLQAPRGGWLRRLFRLKATGRGQ